MTKQKLKLIINIYQNYFNDFINITDKDIDNIYLELAKKDIKQNINKYIKDMTKEKQQRNKSIDFILEFAGDEVESTKDALKIARMTNQELKEDIKSIKEYYKREHKTII